MPPQESLFRTMLRAREGREVNVSRAFEACFSRSSLFRRKVLGALASVCGVERADLLAREWICDSEIAGSYGRFDLRLTPVDGAGKRIILENKVGAPLTKAQMRKYRRAQSDYLIAITKRHPEVGRRWLTANGCLAIRWQDIHATLAHPPMGRGADAFLCNEFRVYLEELDMAYGGSLTKRDLVRVARLLNAIRAERRHAEIRAAPAFEAALQILSLLDDVVNEVRDALPEVSEWGQWGPSYFKWRENDEDYHHFAFRLKRRGWESYCGAGVVLSARRLNRIKCATCWQVGGKETYRESEYGLAEITGRGQALQPHLLAERFVRDIRKSGILRSSAR